MHILIQAILNGNKDLSEALLKKYEIISRNHQDKSYDILVHTLASIGLLSAGPIKKDHIYRHDVYHDDWRISIDDCTTYDDIISICISRDVHPELLVFSYSRLFIRARDVVKNMKIIGNNIWLNDRWKCQTIMNMAFLECAMACGENELVRQIIDNCEITDDEKCLGYVLIDRATMQYIIDNAKLVSIDSMYTDYRDGAWLYEYIRYRRGEQYAKSVLEMNAGILLMTTYTTAVYTNWPMIEHILKTGVDMTDMIDVFHHLRCLENSDNPEISRIFHRVKSFPKNLAGNKMTDVIIYCSSM